mgnify:CR=1 FL=1
MKKFLVLALVLAIVSGCAGFTTPQKTGATVAALASTAPTLAYALDDVYAALIKAKAVPSYQAEATKVLASLDAIAPMVHAQGAALAGDQFNWASFVINAAITAVKVMGIW